MQRIANLLLKKNGIEFDQEEFSFQIQSHPSYPSLHAITGVLNHFNIDNVAARVPNTKESLSLLPNYFIGQFQDDKGQGLYLVEKKEDLYKLFNAEGNPKVFSTNQFLNVFTGVILAVEQQENNTKKITSKNLYTTIGFVITIVSLLSIFLMTTSIVSTMVFLLSCIGILFSISIIQQELGIKNSIGDAFCSSDSDKKGCNAVLTSDGARLFKSYKLSDVSLIYFLGFTISAFLLNINGQNLQLLHLASLLVLPVTIYSIYYQAVTVKLRCLLCLSIVAVLWTQAGISLFSKPFLTDINFNLITILIILVGFFFSFSIWSFLKPKYQEAIENKSHKIASVKFKRNYNLFSTLLKSNERLNTVIKSENQIVYGNPESKLEIVLVTNPFCGHCKPVHTIIEDILKKYGENVKVIVRFNINLGDTNNEDFVISSNLLKIHLTQGEKESKIAMHEAYNELSPKEWLNKWVNQTIDNELYMGMLLEHQEWCIENRLNFTPSILINGYAFPKEYERKDLLLFMEELHEEYNE